MLGGSYVLIGSTLIRLSFDRLSRHSATEPDRSLSSLRTLDMYPSKSASYGVPMGMTILASRIS